MPLAIPVSENSYFQICVAVQWLCEPDRGPFLKALVDELEGSEIGDGVVARAVAKAFKTFYRPVEVSEEPQQLRKLTYGSNKLEAKSDAIEANRQRRQRVDAR